MVRRPCRSWGRFSRKWILIAVILLSLAGNVFPSEPVGNFQFEVDWVREHVVRVRLQALTLLDDVTLTVTTPVEFALNPLEVTAREAFRHAPADTGRLAFRTDLPQLDPATRVVFEFEWILPLDRAGVLEFIVEGRNKSGRFIRDAVGFSARESGSAGTRRLGAVEFPAAVIRPATEER